MSLHKIDWETGRLGDLFVVRIFETGITQPTESVIAT